MTRASGPVTLANASCDAAGVTVVTAGDKRFKKVLAELFEEHNFRGQCEGPKGSVNVTYARTYMRPRATVVAWYGRPVCTKDGGCSCGFGLGFTKRVKELGRSVFYVDLVCSQERKGGKILAAMESYAKSVGADVVALRAAVPDLIALYEKKGYHRMANACVPPSRAGRIALRELDRFAGPVGPRGAGVYTNGTQVVSSPADAWRAANKKPPSGSRGSALPEGWRLEEGQHGYWMSKCL